MILDLLCIVLLQDPVPDPAPAPTPAPAPGPLDLEAELQRLADQVRQDFAQLHEVLRQGLDTLEKTKPEDLQEHLRTAQGKNNQLLTDMEALLDAIPESENDSPGGSSSAGGGGKSPPSQPNNQQGQQPQPSQESEDGKGPPPELRNTLLLDTRPGAWGTLPPRLQAALRQAVIEDLPLRYRPWLEKFHRRSDP